MKIAQSIKKWVMQFRLGIVSTLVLLMAQGTVAAVQAPDSAPQDAPHIAAMAFYKWYVKETVLEENPNPWPYNWSVLGKYVSSIYIKEIKKEQAQDPKSGTYDDSISLGADYFIRTQDYSDDWASHVSAATNYVYGNNAEVILTMGAKVGGLNTVRIKMVKEKGEWKIHRVFGVCLKQKNKSNKDGDCVD